jgi:type I restriction enzyme S subunit
MDSKTFFDNFETIADAPDGISRLRDLILDLAVRGKLVQQVVSDQPSTFDSCEGSFEIPTSWRWAPLSLVAGDLGQEVPKTKFHYIDVGSINSVIGCISDDAAILESSKAPSRARKKVGLGTVLYSTVRPYLRNIAIIDREFQPKAIASTAFAVLHPNECIESKFLFVCVRSPYFTRFVESKQKGVAYPAINASDLKEALIPLPPFDEQKRIVAKVDELMELCDELETAQNQRNSIRTAARKSVIDSISTATTPIELNAAWKRISNNWTTIAGTPESISSLRSLILDLAVRGLLSDPNVKFETVLMGDIFDVSGGLQKTPKRTPVRSHFPYLRVANVQRGRLDLAEISRFELSNDELERYKLSPRDLLIVEGNGSEKEIGRCAIWNGEIQDCIHQNHIIRCRPKLPEVEKYALLFLNSPSGTRLMKSLAVTTSGLFTLSVGKIRAIEFRIPPVSEILKIVRKVDELTTLCDEANNALLKQNLLGESLTKTMTRVVNA